MTPGEVLVIPDRSPANSEGWDIRVIPNKYPALQPDGDSKKEGTGYGYHELVITADHNLSLGNLSNDQICKVFQGYVSRFNTIKKDKKIKYGLAIYNHGQSSGASLAHPHSQIIYTSFVPPYVQLENTHFNAHYRKNKTGLLADIIQGELHEKKRVVQETKHFLAWCPYGSRAQCEVWFAPKKCKNSITEMNTRQRDEFACLLRDVLQKLSIRLNNPDFNYYLHNAPFNTQKGQYDNFHWHLELLPRLGIWAGFEFGSDVIINSVYPEDAALYYISPSPSTQIPLTYWQ